MSLFPSASFKKVGKPKSGKSCPNLSEELVNYSITCRLLIHITSGLFFRSNLKIL